MKYPAAVALGALLTAAAYLGLLAWSAGTPPTITAASIEAWLDHKDAIASNIQPPRILIAGGSSNLYGIRADRIQEATGIPTINLGSHAALSLDYLLERIRRVAKPGDIILLGLEYDFFTDAARTAVFSDFVFGSDPGYILQRPPLEAATWLASASGDVLLRPFRDLHPGFPGLREERAKIAAARLDEYGNFVANDLAERRPAQLADVENSRPLFALQSAKRVQSPAAWRSIEQFATWCRDNDIRLAAIFPPTIDRPIYADAPTRRALRAISKHCRELKIPVLGDAEDSFLPVSDFFDSVYHLHAEAAERHTDRILKVFIPWFDSLRADLTNPAPGP